MFLDIAGSTFLIVFLIQSHIITQYVDPCALNFNGFGVRRVDFSPRSYIFPPFFPSLSTSSISMQSSSMLLRGVVRRMKGSVPPCTKTRGPNFSVRLKSAYPLRGFFAAKSNTSFTLSAAGATARDTGIPARGEDVRPADAAVRARPEGAAPRPAGTPTVLTRPPGRLSSFT